MEKKKSKARIIVVLLFILFFVIISFINLKGTYLEYKELGENYIDIFFTNLKYKYIIFAVNFIILYIIIYFTNKGIKKGLKDFFKKENKPIPKLLNKSLAFIFSVLISAFMSDALMKKILLFSSNASFGINDPVFGFDISFYMFIKPLITSLLIYIMLIYIGLIIYMAIYYIIIFNKYFDGIDGKMLKNSLLVKKIIKNVIFIIIIFSLLTILNVTNISLNKMLTIKNDLDQTENIDIIGASYTDVMIQRWGYLVFSVVIIVFSIRAINAFKKENTPKIIRNLLVIPGYLVAMFLVIMVFNLIFVNSNTLDKQKEYLENNISFTKNAYNIDIHEENIESTGTITQTEVANNPSIIDNIKIVNKDIVLKTLQKNQTGTGYYTYRNANIAKYQINGEYKLVYVSPREIKNSGRTYNNKTYEYTHGTGQIVVDSTSIDETGNINYIQKEISGEDDILRNKNSRNVFWIRK